LAQFKRVLLRLHSHIPGKDRPLRRVATGTLHAQHVLKLHFGARQIGEQLGRRGGREVLGVKQLAEPRHEIDMHRFAAKYGVDGNAICLGKLLQFIDSDAALALLDGDQRRTRNRNGIRGLLLRQVSGLTGQAQTLPDLDR